MVFVFIEILFKIVLFKGGVLIYAEHCIYKYKFKVCFGSYPKSLAKWTFLKISVQLVNTVKKNTVAMFNTAAQVFQAKEGKIILLKVWN